MPIKCSELFHDRSSLEHYSLYPYKSFMRIMQKYKSQLEISTLPENMQHVAPICAIFFHNSYCRACPKPQGIVNIPSVW